MKKADRPDRPASPTAIMGLLITGAVILVVLGWIMLGVLLVGMGSLYASFLFGWYWISVEEGALDRWLPCVIGALVGLGFSYIVHVAPMQFGALAGTLLVLLVLAAMIYIQVMNLADIVVNRCTMLFATVLTAADLLAHIDFVLVAAAIISAAIYVLAIISTLQAIQKRQLRAKNS